MVVAQWASLFIELDYSAAMTSVYHDLAIYSLPVHAVPAWSA